MLAGAGREAPRELADRCAANAIAQSMIDKGRYWYCRFHSFVATRQPNARTPPPVWSPCYDLASSDAAPIMMDISPATDRPYATT